MGIPPWLRIVFLSALLTAAVIAWHNRPQPPEPTVPVASTTAVLVGAGDIASCTWNGDEATAALLDQIPGTVFTTGDNIYDDKQSYEQCYGPSWGRHRERTRPTPGNHDYSSLRATEYFNYFGARAGTAGQGYYSYELGEWHIVALNSNCQQVGGCTQESPQGHWLENDLASHPSRCTLAYWHHPRFNSGNHGPAQSVRPLWQILYAHGAELVLNGHAHDYERFAPQTPNGELDEGNGIREFVIGTGGSPRTPFNAPAPNSEVRNNDTFGVLKLTLERNSYRWEFVPQTGGTFIDTGTGRCHD